MTPGSVNEMQSASSSPPSSPPSTDMEYQEPKPAAKREQQETGPLMQLEHYLNVTQVCSSSLTAKSRS